MLLQMALFCSFLWLSNIALCMCVYISHLLCPFPCWWTPRLFLWLVGCSLFWQDVKPCCKLCFSTEGPHTDQRGWRLHYSLQLVSNKMLFYSYYRILLDDFHQPSGTASLSSNHWYFPFWLWSRKLGNRTCWRWESESNRLWIRDDGTWLEEARTPMVYVQVGTTIGWTQVGDDTEKQPSGWSTYESGGSGVPVYYLARVICRQGLEQRIQDPALLEGAEVRQESRPQPRLQWIPSLKDKKLFAANWVKRSMAEGHRMLCCAEARRYYNPFFCFNPVAWGTLNGQGAALFPTHWMHHCYKTGNLGSS